MSIKTYVVVAPAVTFSNGWTHDGKLIVERADRGTYLKFDDVADAVRVQQFLASGSIAPHVPGQAVPTVPTIRAVMFRLAGFDDTALLAASTAVIEQPAPAEPINL